MTREWRSRREWVTEGKPDVKYLKTMFEDAVVPVADCGKTEFGSHPKQDMLLSEYMTYWQRVMNISETSSTCDCQPERILYLKDWHFTKAYPDYGAYDLPSHFSVDWLNEFWSKRPDKRDDYRFVYMGPKGTWTPFHADVYRSYSWSANICGSKRWLLVPPYGEENFKDSYGNTLVDIRNVKGNSKTTSPIEVIQNAGEVIFIPSGWYHQVENLDDTISINHNWANACNVDIMFEKLRSDLDEVQCAIGDCTEMDGWHEQCQAILLANSGVNYMEFIQYISTIADRVLRELECLRSSNTAEHKTEFLPSSLDVLSALVLFDFSAKRSLKLEEEIITTSGELVQIVYFRVF
ncbi:2-oxoglutarate and iron-dependent oxygenase JMJD4-like isoform X1 [Corticium candelabrum]|uniref:2-oxoglutarate and iron-dependent oxygenase JMJD4-like isoform X1 n=1 Tax=Corticium candelabrum TaxID=121492 RepID=UPI002E27148A|nr:2-oxoglutarate and iron-dependent oxygenase JMJD4-like isoform X1 [Corticium candelabrum]